MSQPASHTGFTAAITRTYASRADPSERSSPISASTENGESNARSRRILHVEDNVPFSTLEVTRRLALGDPVEDRLAKVIQASLASGERADGAVHKVFILSPPGDSETVELAEPLPHEGEGKGSAFTMGQRYVYLEDLKAAQSTADLR